MQLIFFQYFAIDREQVGHKAQNPELKAHQHQNRRQNQARHMRSRRAAKIQYQPPHPNQKPAVNGTVPASAKNRRGR
jgi:sRNA-binding protein